MKRLPKVTITVFGVILSLAIASISEAAPSNPPSVVHFPRGKVQVTATDAIARGETGCWTLEARRRQHLAAIITSPENNAVFQIYRPGWQLNTSKDGLIDVHGATSKGAGQSDDAQRWAGNLLDNGSYLIVVGATRGGAPYSINIKVR